MVTHTLPTVVISWQDKSMEIRSEVGKHTLPLDKNIHVVMTGYPDQESKIMPARGLGPYMSRGYIIEHIAFEE